MKRVLALFTAILMMILPMGTNALASSDYEAELLSDLSVMQGDPDGNMRYEDMVSRAECAKIIVAASRYRDLVDMSSKRSPFKDVAYDHWAAPYVTTGIKNNLFKGYFDATFRPSNTVTYEEAITMLLRVLDYTDEDVGDNWPYDQIDMAKRIGIIDGVGKTIGQKLTRRDISKMIYNTLNSNAKGSQEKYLTDFNQTIGPVTVTSSNWYEKLGADSSVKVIRDGVKASVSDVRINDIAYYMVEYNKAFVYSKKVTGIYENASPNKDAPVCVTVSGVTYNIEGDEAYSKLSSGGDFNYGDTVTLLLGKAGDVASVVGGTENDAEVTGFMSATGTKDTIVSGTNVTKNYIRIVLPSGEACEYITEKNYESYLNRVVSVKLTNGLATVSPVAENNNISGKVMWASGAGTLGQHTLASDIKIIEVSTTDSYKTATVASVYPQRLNEAVLSENDILYVSKNSDGNIDALILKDITGDMHTYGVMTHVKNNNDGWQNFGEYEYIVGGSETSLITQNKTFSVSAGQVVKIKSNGREVESIVALSRIKDKKITNVSGNIITMGNSKYIMSDKVQIYLRSSSYDYVYNMITIDELAQKTDEYMAYAYTDSSVSSGGRIRVVILQKN